MEAQQLRIWDNCQGKYLSDWDSFSDENKRDLEEIANISVKELTETNPGLLIFPLNLNENKDDIGNLSILNINKEKLSTGNLMGFVGRNETQINICSRFSKKDDKDYFLHYMLCKVYRINLFNLHHEVSKDPIFDFLLYLFPHYLKKALRQGLFKQYQRRQFNDSKVRGVINVSRHIRENIPFKGTICYDTREHSYDNNITQLIRHTIEYIKIKPLGQAILQNEGETKACVSQIVLATPTYSHNSRQKIINANIRPVRHPYFYEYTALQRLCLQILRHESLKYGKEKDKVYGVLFDGAWLWEEYLATILREIGFKHPENKSQSGGFYMFRKPEDDNLFSKNSRRLYPDFYRENDSKEKYFILDAKYKHLNNGVSREDLYQVVTYMYCTKANNGGYVYPFEQQKEEYTTYSLSGYGGKITVFPFHIPQKDNQSVWSFDLFSTSIANSEIQIKKNINSLKNSNS